MKEFSEVNPANDGLSPEAYLGGSQRYVWKAATPLPLQSHSWLLEQNGGYLAFEWLPRAAACKT